MLKLFWEKKNMWKIHNQNPEGNPTFTYEPSTAKDTNSPTVATKMTGNLTAPHQAHYPD